MNSNNIEYNGTRQKGTRQKDEFDFKKILNQFLQHWKLYILSIVILVFSWVNVYSLFYSFIPGKCSGTGARWTKW